MPGNSGEGGVSAPGTQCKPCASPDQARGTLVTRDFGSQGQPGLLGVKLTPEEREAGTSRPEIYVLTLYTWFLGFGICLFALYWRLTQGLCTELHPSPLDFQTRSH